MSATDLPASPSFRAPQATLIDDYEGSSVQPVPSTVKNCHLLTVLTGPSEGTILQLGAGELTLGRSKESDLMLPDPGLSRVHAKFTSFRRGRERVYQLEDCGSTNGTFVAGTRITQPTELADGVRVGFGRRTLARFSVQDPLEEQALLRVHDNAQRDPLTRVYNRKVFDERLRREFQLAQRYNRPLSVVLFDIDHFKNFNDEHGHQVGDAILCEVAHQVDATLRVDDIMARYGGEEFAVLAHGTAATYVAVLGERIRRVASQVKVEWQGAPLNVTVSVGCACSILPEGESLRQAATEQDLLRWADQALYAAKRAGRNCVVVDGAASRP